MTKGGGGSVPEDQVEGRLLLDVVVRKGAAVLELLAGEDETLLVRGDALLVLDLGLDLWEQRFVSTDNTTTRFAW